MLSDDVKNQFPTLVNDPDLVYLDNAASTQTHQSVLDKMNEYYEKKRCNVNRGDFKISQEVSQEIQDARESVANLIKAIYSLLCIKSSIDLSFFVFGLTCFLKSFHTLYASLVSLVSLSAQRRFFSHM